jgi:hypothetical protein
MKLGKCPMCDTDKQIVKSHLFPRASYKYFREQGFEPLFLSQEVVHPTNKQIWAHLLCQECEDVLNSGGETWLIPLLACYSSDFPLYDLVVRGRPVDDQDPKVYATEGVAGLDSEKLVVRKVNERTDGV